MIPANGTFVQGVTTISDDELNTLVQGCTSAAQLRTFVGLSNMTVMLLGISGPGDSSGGVFYWQNGQGFADDNYNVIVPQGVTRGAWLRAALQTNAYGIDFSYVAQASPPTANQLVGAAVVTQNVTFPVDFAGSAGNVQNLPTLPFVMSVFRSDVADAVGTVTIGTDGTFDFDTFGDTIVLTPGQQIEFRAQADPDATVNNFCWRIVAESAP
jgi:hypothetical protein